MTVLTFSRVIRAPREQVFAAWVEPDSLVQWWGPGPVTCPEASVDLRVGGRYKIANRELDGSITWISGEFTLVRPPVELAYTWRVSIIPGDPTLVTVRLNEHPEGTLLVLTHEGFADDSVRDMHLMGWSACVDKLQVFLERP